MQRSSWLAVENSDVASGQLLVLLALETLPGKKPVELAFHGAFYSTLQTELKFL